jgi:hypothetical chaperone protein
LSQWRQSAKVAPFFTGMGILQAMFIGFDYGTANCSVAVMRDNTPQLLTLENGSSLLPSMLCAPTREAVSEWLYRHHDVPPNGDENQALLSRDKLQPRGRYRRTRQQRAVWSRFAASVR